MSNWFGNVFPSRGTRGPEAHDDVSDELSTQSGAFKHELQAHLVEQPAAEVRAQHLQRMSDASQLPAGLPDISPPHNAAAENAAEEDPVIRRIVRKHSTRIALVTAALLTLTSGMAFAGALPDSMQQGAADAASTVGLELPDPQELDEAADEASEAADEAAEAAAEAAEAAQDAAHKAAEDAADAAEEAADATDDAAQDAAEEADDLVHEQELENADGDDGDFDDNSGDEGDDNSSDDGDDISDTGSSDDNGGDAASDQDSGADGDDDTSRSADAAEESATSDGGDDD